jgi:uncharacterized protein YukE
VAYDIEFTRNQEKILRELRGIKLALEKIAKTLDKSGKSYTLADLIENKEEENNEE